MKIIVLSISAYKEKDAIISAISENEFITFLVRGLKGPKSKNTALNNALTIADIELMDGTFKHPILKSSKPLFTPMRLEMDSKYLGSLLIMNEVTNYLFPDEEKARLFKYLEDGLTLLKQKNDWLMTLLIYFAQAIRLGGLELEVNCCVRCGKKNRIVAFSFVEGGFICENCADEEISYDLSKNQMILLRKIFNSRDYHLLDEQYDRDDALVLLRKIMAYMEEAFGYHFKNQRLILD